MTEQYIRSRRLVLSEINPDAKRTVDVLSRQLGWPLQSEREEDRDEWTPRQIVWGVGPAITLQYQEDLLSDLAYLFVVGSDPKAVQNTLDIAAAHLPVWTLTGLVDAVRGETDPDDLPYAIHRLGLGAPRQFDEDVYACITEHIRSEDPEVRDSAVWAVTYEPWPEHVDALRELLSTNSDDELSRTVRNLLLEMSKEGV
ncbi:hypothetical protein ACIQPP_48070 [Streptomyces violaceusniger]|uniref:hypothetical protein n=1 Tax=Streptomyces violaceusniger TaxID=68280 RepID=UPI0009C2F536|nr:hypothetical protein [Streptomyces hygroscopicus]AQW48343.1 hypothetical protein SHXM_01806 [Streptomyces hygroscopicus]